MEFLIVIMLFDMRDPVYGIRNRMPYRDDVRSVSFSYVPFKGSADACEATAKILAADQAIKAVQKLPHGVWRTETECTTLPGRRDPD